MVSYTCEQEPHTEKGRNSMEILIIIRYGLLAAEGFFALRLVHKIFTDTLFRED